MSYTIRSSRISLIKLINLIHCSLSFDNLIYINKNDVILDIPKSGSSFIKSNIIHNKKSLVSINANYPHTAIFKRPLKGITKVEKIKNIYVFIKDPIERFCSVYREKVLNHSFLKKNWSPKSYALNIKKYEINDINSIVQFLKQSNYKDIDKHLLPQYQFIKKYLGQKNLKILQIQDLTEYSKNFFNDDLYFSSALRTDKELFNISDISKKNLEFLNDFYRDDINLINQSFK